MRMPLRDYLALICDNLDKTLNKTLLSSFVIVEHIHLPLPLVMLKLGEQPDTYYGTMAYVLQKHLQRGKKNVLTSGLHEEGNGWNNSSLSWLMDERLHVCELGSSVLRFLLLETMWFVPDKDNRYFFQLCGAPFVARQEPKDKSLEIFRFSMLYSVDHFEQDAWYDKRPSHLCRFIFGLDPKRRHLKPRYKAVLDDLLHLSVCMVDHVNKEEEEPEKRIHYAPDHVVHRLWNFVKSVVPDQLLSRHNKRVLRNLVRVLVCSSMAPYKKKFINLIQWSYRWCIEQENKVWTRDMVAHWLYFIVNSMCIPWLKQRYYITEQSHSSNLYYYDKHLWRMKHPMPPERMGMVRIRLASLKGLPRLRLVPKDDMGWEVRPIASPSDFKDIRVRVAHAILKRILPVGFSLFDLRKAKQKIESDTKWTHAIKMDVRLAYDNVDQQRLWGFVQQALRNAEAGPFTVRFFSFNGKGAARIDPHSAPLGTLVSDNCTSWTMTKQELLSTVEKYIFGHTIVYRGKAYQQTKGIWQGSVLSPLMCSFYLSCVMDDVSIKVEQPLGQLLRYTDDHLFLAQSMEAVKDFRFAVQELLPWNDDKMVIFTRGQAQIWCGIKI